MADTQNLPDAPGQPGPLPTLGLAQWGLIAVLLVAPVLAGLGTLSAGPVSDDFRFLFGPLSFPDSLLRPWQHNMGSTEGFRPVVVASYLLTRAACGGAHLVACARVTNLLVHGLNAGLLFLVGWRLRLGTWPSLAAALVFTVHPATHENVMWIAGRTFPIAAVGTLGAVLASMGPAATWRARVTAGVLTFAALASYEGAIATPALAVAAAWGGGNRGRRLLCSAIGPLVALALYLVLRWWVLVSAANDLSFITGDRQLAWLSWPGIRRSLGNVLSAAGRLAGSDQYFLTSPSATTVALAALVAASAALVVVNWGRARDTLAPVTGLAAALIVGGFLPFVALLAFTERFAYLCVAGTALFVAAGAWSARGHARMGAAFGCLVMVSIALMLAQYTRIAGDWREAGALAETIARQSAAAAIAHPRATTVELYRLPAVHGRALVYPTYYDLAVQLLVPRRVGVGASGADPPADRRSTADTLVLVWNASSRTVTVR